MPKFIFGNFGNFIWKYFPKFTKNFQIKLPKIGSATETNHIQPDRVQPELDRIEIMSQVLYLIR